MTSFITDGAGAHGDQLAGLSPQQAAEGLLQIAERTLGADPSAA